MTFGLQEIVMELGFWDRGLGDVGDALTKLASSMGEKHLFWGEDGKINIE